MTSPLIGAEELHGRLGDADLRIADTRWYLGEPERGHAAYARSHIPGAAYVDLERDLSAATGPGRHPLPAPDDFAARLGELGISNQALVVAYDDRGGAVAARLWWMLRALGHHRVAVLDGGLPAWEAAGLPVTAETRDREPARFVGSSEWPDVIDRDQLARSLGTVTLLDARAPARYHGEVEPIDSAAGHIPTARNADYEGNLGGDGHFRPAADLANRYRSLGVRDGSSVVAYCGSGVTACHDLLALEVAGLPGGRLYPGSWSDWSASGGEVATG